MVELGEEVLVVLEFEMGWCYVEWDVGGKGWICWGRVGWYEWGNLLLNLGKGSLRRNKC